MLFGSVFQAFAADTVNDRAPHAFLHLCSIISSLFAELVFPQSGLTRLRKATCLCSIYSRIQKHVATTSLLQANYVREHGERRYKYRLA